LRLVRKRNPIARSSRIPTRKEEERIVSFLRRWIERRYYGRLRSRPKNYMADKEALWSIGVIAHVVELRPELLPMGPKLKSITFLKAGEFKDTGNPAREDGLPPSATTFKPLINDMHTPIQSMRVARGERRKRVTSRLNLQWQSWTGDQAYSMKTGCTNRDFRRRRRRIPPMRWESRGSPVTVLAPIQAIGADFLIFGDVPNYLPQPAEAT